MIEKGVLLISFYIESIFIAIGSLFLLLLIQSLPIIWICCMNPKLSLGVLSGERMTKQFSSGGPRIWLRFVVNTLFKSDAPTMVVFSDMDQISLTRSHLINGICKLLIMDSLLSIGILAIITRYLPLPYSELQFIKGAMIFAGALTGIFLVISIATRKTIRAQEIIVSKIFTVADFIQYAVEEKVGEDPQKIAPYMTVLHRLFSGMKIKDLSRWLNQIDMNHYIDVFETNQKVIMGKQDNPMPLDPVNRRDISSWSIWLKQFIGQSMLTDLIKATPKDSIQKFNQDDQRIFETLKDCCHILPCSNGLN